MSRTSPAPGLARETEPMSSLVEAFDNFHTRLHAHINNRLPDDEWHLGEDLAMNVWMRALESADLDDLRVDSPTELPVWLIEAARAELREHRNGIDSAHDSEPTNHDFHDATLVEGTPVVLPVDVDDFTRQQPEPQFALVAG